VNRGSEALGAVIRGALASTARICAAHDLENRHRQDRAKLAASARMMGHKGWPRCWCRSSRPGQACRGFYPARAGGPWLCSTLVLSLFRAVVVPSRVEHQGPAPAVDHDLVVERAEQDAVLHGRLAAVGLCRVWWTSQAEAGWLQPPAHRQWRSRRVTVIGRRGRYWPWSG
jgi:hypothetical protein